MAIAEAGIHTYALARSADALAELAASNPTAITPVPCDLTDTDAMDAAIARCKDVSILINNAGWATPRISVRHSRLEDWHRTLATCLVAPMRITHALLPSMIERGSGAIIQILSPAAQRGRAGEAAYAAAKSGLRGFTESLREELADTSIKVCCIYPGLVDTDFVPPNRKVDRTRFLVPGDVADVVIQCLESSQRVAQTDIVINPHETLKGR